jgi:hypothetical protein
MQHKIRKCDLFILDDQLGPSARHMVAVPSNASIEQSKKDSLKEVHVIKCNTPFSQRKIFFIIKNQSISL